MLWQRAGEHSDVQDRGSSAGCWCWLYVYGVNMKVSRYDIECNDYSAFSVNLHPEGDYVEYCEYADLLDKYNDLCNQITDLYKGI
jgi:hypothetical protein